MHLLKYLVVFLSYFRQTVGWLSEARKMCKVLVG